MRREKPADRGGRLAFLVTAWLQRSKEKSTYLLLLDVLLRGTVVLAGLRAVVAELVVLVPLVTNYVALHLFFNLILWIGAGPFILGLFVLGLVCQLILWFVKIWEAGQRINYYNFWI